MNLQDFKQLSNSFLQEENIDKKLLLSTKIIKVFSDFYLATYSIELANKTITKFKLDIDSYLKNPKTFDSIMRTTFLGMELHLSKKK